MRCCAQHRRIQAEVVAVVAVGVTGAGKITRPDVVIVRSRLIRRYSAGGESAWSSGHPDGILGAC